MHKKLGYKVNVMDLLVPLNTVSQRQEVRSFCESFDFRVARSKEELEEAYRLVYEEYLKRGYVKENPSRIRLSLFNALPETTTFVAVKDNKEIIATATVIPDSAIGLPMDGIYSNELNELRAAGKKICEISMLASKPELLKQEGLSVLLKRLFFMLSFFKTILDYVREYLELDYMCITINPKYNEIFKLILFKDLGGLKSYHQVNGAPAIAKYLDVRSVREGFSVPSKETLYKIFVEKTTKFDKFFGKINMEPNHLKYFFLEKTNIFRESNAEKLEHIKKCYPFLFNETFEQISS